MCSFSRSQPHNQTTSTRKYFHWLLAFSQSFFCTQRASLSSILPFGAFDCVKKTNLNLCALSEICTWTWIFGAFFILFYHLLSRSIDVFFWELQSMYINLNRDSRFGTLHLRQHTFTSETGEFECKLWNFRCGYEVLSGRWRIFFVKIVETFNNGANDGSERCSQDDVIENLINLRFATQRRKSLSDFSPPHSLYLKMRECIQFKTPEMGWKWMQRSHLELYSNSLYSIYTLSVIYLNNVFMFTKRLGITGITLNVRFILPLLLRIKEFNWNGGSTFENYTKKNRNNAKKH